MIFVRGKSNKLTKISTRFPRHVSKCQTKISSINVKNIKIECFVLIMQLQQVRCECLKRKTLSFQNNSFLPIIKFLFEKFLQKFMFTCDVSKFSHQVITMRVLTIKNFLISLKNLKDNGTKEENDK